MGIASKGRYGWGEWLFKVENSKQYRYIGATQDVHNYLITTKKSDIDKIYRYSVFFKAKYEIARFFLPRSGLLEHSAAAHYHHKKTQSADSGTNVNRTIGTPVHLRTFAGCKG